MDEGGIRKQKTLDHGDVESVADGLGLLEVEEVANGKIIRKGRSALGEAHEALSFNAAERAKKSMTLLRMDELGQATPSEE